MDFCVCLSSTVLDIGCFEWVIFSSVWNELSTDLNRLSSIINFDASINTFNV